VESGNVLLVGKIVAAGRELSGVLSELPGKFADTETLVECLYKVHTTQFADAATFVGNGIVSYIVPAIQYDDTW
jgi:hypothetical protein